MPRALDPYVIKLADGKDYEFYFSMSAAKNMGRRARQEGALAIELVSGALFDSCANKGEMTLEDFEQILPGDPDWLQAQLIGLQRHSGACCSRPPVASAATPDPPATTGSPSGQPPEQTSE